MFDERDFAKFMIAFVVIGIFIGIFLIVGIPWIWNIIKPWLHVITG